MKELPDQFEGKGEVKGFFFTQIKQTPNGYIYSKEYDGRTTYEVFQRKENVNEAWDINKVSYPTSKAFGIWAWETKDYKQALTILENIDKAANDK